MVVDLIITESLETEILNLMMTNLIFDLPGFAINIYSDYKLNM